MRYPANSAPWLNAAMASYTSRGGVRARASGLLDDLRLGVADDLVSALLGDGLDHRPAVGDLRHLTAHDELLLEQPDAAELDRQALERLRAARRLGLRPRDPRHRP